MPAYIVLGNFTDQGVRAVKDTVKRADAVRDAAGRFGVKMNSIYWTHGAYDIVAQFDAESDAAMTAFSLAVASQGNVRLQTLRAFDRDELTEVLAKLP